MKKVYVAGLYSGSDGHNSSEEFRLKNTQVAIEAGRQLIKLGFIPYIPHLSHYVHSGWTDPVDPHVWYELDLEWMVMCDAVLLLPNWKESSGAQAERALAKYLGMPVFEDIDDVIDYFKYLGGK